VRHKIWQGKLEYNIKKGSILYTVTSEHNADVNATMVLGLFNDPISAGVFMLQQIDEMVFMTYERKE
jgi:hypothetical protein